MKSIKEDLCVFLLRLKNGVQRALKQNELALRSQLLEERGVQGSFYVVFCLVLFFWLFDFSTYYNTACIKV